MKTITLLAILLSILVITGCTQITDVNLKDNLSYEECVQEAIKEARIYKPASEEGAGAQRTDEEGIVWVKENDGFWRTNDTRRKNSGKGDVGVDRLIGGVDYNPKKFPACEQYRVEVNRSECEHCIEGGVEFRDYVPKCDIINNIEEYDDFFIYGFWQGQGRNIHYEEVPANKCLNFEIKTWETMLSGELDIFAVKKEFLEKVGEDDFYNNRHIYSAEIYSFENLDIENTADFPYNSNITKVNYQYTINNITKGKIDLVLYQKEIVYENGSIVFE